MNTKTLRIFIIVALVVLAAVILITQLQKPTTQEPKETADLSVGCYIARFEANTYTLEIEEMVNDAVVGNLTYDNADIDSSTGTFVGTYDDPILLGDYVFESEGMNSARQVIFKRLENGGLVQGFGSVTVSGNYEKFRNLDNITFSQAPVFNKWPCN